MIKNTIVFIIDGTLSSNESESRISLLDDLISFCAEKAECYFSLLGENDLWTQQEWLDGFSGLAGPQQSNHFIAPIFSTIQKMELNPNQFVVISDERILDLEDWALLGEQWMIITDAPEYNHKSILKFSPQNIEGIFSWLLKTNPPYKNPPRLKTSGFLGHKWTLDFCGFPMIFVPEINVYWHLFPLTWAQFESQFYNQPDQGMNEKVYSSLIKDIGERVSVQKVSTANKLDIFVTGLYAHETINYLGLLDETYQLPTAEQWRKAWTWLESQPLSALSPQIENQLNPLARKLWIFVHDQLSPNNLLELTLMKNGLLEWAFINGERIEGNLVGMGKPKKNYPFHHPLTHDPIKPTAVEKRSKLFGLRLFRRESW